MLWWLCRHLVLACLETVDLSDSHLIFSKKNILLHLLSQFIVVPFILLPLNSRGLIHPLRESPWNNRGHTQVTFLVFTGSAFVFVIQNMGKKGEGKKKGWPHSTYIITLIMRSGLLTYSPPLSNKLRQLLSLCPCSRPPPVLSPLLAGSRCPIWHIRTDKQETVRWWALVLDPWLSTLLNL